MQDSDKKGIEDAIRDANPPLFPDLDTTHARLRAAAKANVAHTPRQQGPWLVCVSCPMQHTITWIGVDKKLVGIDAKGAPILEQRF